MVDQPFLPASKELDHIVPINVGGTHTIGNVRIVCRSCNGARPADGSDYTGPVTLWAQDPTVVLPPIKAAGLPKPAAAKRMPRRAEGERAAEMRAAGMRWQDIANAVGIENTGYVYNLAKQWGRPEHVAMWLRRAA